MKTSTATIAPTAGAALGAVVLNRLALTLVEIALLAGVGLVVRLQAARAERRAGAS
jgi:hypothetical protein